MREPPSGGFYFGRSVGRLPLLGTTRTCPVVAACPLFGAERKTLAQSEFFRFDPKRTWALLIRDRLSSISCSRGGLKMLDFKPRQEPCETGTHVGCRSRINVVTYSATRLKKD